MVSEELGLVGLIREHLGKFFLFTVLEFRVVPDRDRLAHLVTTVYTAKLKLLELIVLAASKDIIPASVAVSLLKPLMWYRVGGVEGLERDIRRVSNNITVFDDHVFSGLYGVVNHYHLPFHKLQSSISNGTRVILKFSIDQIRLEGFQAEPTPRLLHFMGLNIVGGV